MDYESIARKLPTPTWDQCERFARYVSVAHSWYKHLPIDKDALFFLFLDPTAGSILENVEGKGWRPVEITPGSPQHRAHTTAVYRERFGFWNYQRLHINGTWDIFGPPHAFLADGQRIFLTESRRNTGRASVNAFLHSNSPLLYIGGFDRFQRPEWIGKSIFECVQLFLEERLAARTIRLKDVLESEIPVEIRGALPTTQLDPYNDSWPNEGWKRQLLDRRVPDRYWSPLCKYVQLIADERNFAYPESHG